MCEQFLIFGSLHYGVMDLVYGHPAVRSLSPRQTVPLRGFYQFPGWKEREKVGGGVLASFLLWEQIGALVCPLLLILADLCDSPVLLLSLSRVPLRSGGKQVCLFH